MFLRVNFTDARRMSTIKTEKVSHKRVMLTFFVYIGLKLLG